MCGNNGKGVKIRCHSLEGGFHPVTAVCQLKHNQSAWKHLGVIWLHNPHLTLLFASVIVSTV